MENTFGCMSKTMIFVKSTRKLKQHILLPNGFLLPHLIDSNRFAGLCCGPFTMMIFMKRVDPENIDHVRLQSIAVLKGEISGENSGIPLGKMLASLREELLQFIPEESISRFTQMIDRYFMGLETELTYKKKKTFPTVEECIALRENSICLYPFLQLTEVETGIILPQEIHEHPVIRRLQALACIFPLYILSIYSSSFSRLI